MRLDVYHYMIIFLLVSAATAMYQAQQFYLQIVVIPAVAALTDFAITYYKTKQKNWPLSAIISGLIIASIMPALDLVIQIFVALLSVVQKHVIRWRGSHIFNPAAFSVLIASLLFLKPPTWWIGTSAVVLIFLLTANMVKRLVISGIFYASYLILSLIRAGGVSSIAFLDYTAIFFALVMAVEPKTTPLSQKGMILFGIGLSILSFVIQFAQLPVDFFIASLLVMNIFNKDLNKLK